MELVQGKIYTLKVELYDSTGSPQIVAFFKDGRTSIPIRALKPKIIMATYKGKFESIDTNYHHFETRRYGYYIPEEAIKDAEMQGE